ncbi:MAG: MATE family efflux transporter, partial [Actinobacteria bacterium]|nr:MATE family efflux transporter [Actinomycetota bacterium]
TYLRVVTWSLPPLLLYSAFRRYLQAVHLVQPVMFALLSANVVNAAINWVLIYGHLGAPALGVEGAAWATCISRLYMAIVLFGAIVHFERRAGAARWRRPPRLEPRRLWRLMALGLPAASQVTLEVGVFAAASALAGRLEPAALAAHQIALNIASVTFMVPYGIASAAAVRVGNAIGARDPARAGRSGWMALLLGLSFMSLAALAFVLVPRSLLQLFTLDGAVITTGVSLLFVAALFQMFDGVQGVATGALRGLGDTRTPMITNLVAHWAIGLPLGYALCFWGGQGVVGLWAGLSAGLVIVAIVLVLVWALRVRQITAAPVRAV